MGFSDTNVSLEQAPSQSVEIVMLSKEEKSTEFSLDEVSESEKRILRIIKLLDR